MQQSNKTNIHILQFNKTQQYSWGSTNQKSFVSQMSSQSHGHYAQFWMGIHPNGQSLLSQQLSLRQFLQDNNKNELKFLFKILSIQKCLSIQVHPNKTEAEILHKNFRNLYGDGQDKPEMFFTLSQFQLFLGFINEAQYQKLQQIQPFRQLGSHIKSQSYKQKILQMLKILVNLQAHEILQNINILGHNIFHFSQSRKSILQRLLKQYPNDMGILVSCLLNHLRVPSSSCYFIPSGIPHAYIHGQCLQLMNNSDNVVRLGLTQKIKDIHNLISIVSNNFENFIFKVQGQVQNNEIKYQCQGFCLTEVKLSKQSNHYIDIQNDSIGLLIQGYLTCFDHSNANPIQIHEKTVFYIEKGIYQFSGQNQLYLASRK